MENGERILVDANEHAERVKRAMAVAKSKGVPDFVVNARTDTLLLGGTVDEALKRGQLYLAAGACTVLVFGGLARGVRDDEVRQLVEGLDGRISVICRIGAEGSWLGVKEIKDLNVARISVGPGVWKVGLTAVKKEMERLLEDSSL